MGDKELEDYTIAEIIEVDAETKATVMPIRFDGRSIPFIIQQLERVTDAVTGQSQNARGQQLRGDGTLGEAKLLAAYQSENTNALAARAAVSLEEAWELVQEMVVSYSKMMFQPYGELLAPEFWEVMDLPVDWDAVGRDTGQSPEIRAAQLSKYEGYAQRPDSEIWWPNLEQKIFEEDNVIEPEEVLVRSQKLKEIAQQSALGGGGGIGGAAGGVVPEPGMGVGASDLAGLGL